MSSLHANSCGSENSFSLSDLLHSSVLICVTVVYIDKDNCSVFSDLPLAQIVNGCISTSEENLDQLLLHGIQIHLPFI